jgi:hypothetical protein
MYKKRIPFGNEQTNKKSRMVEGTGQSKSIIPAFADMMYKTPMLQIRDRKPSAKNVI